jgi:uncharacterized membrane protein
VETIASIEKALDEHRTPGEALADRFAAVVGSWPFILGQTVFLLAWVVVNLLAIVRHWDPYPFILLNLVLSFQAAFTSPIIMMSQNRQGRVATRRNELDLQINLLAEQESSETLRLLRRLCQHLDVDLSDPPHDELEARTSPEDVARQIEASRQNDERNQRHHGIS